MVALVVHAMTASASPSTRWVSQPRDSLALSYDAAWLREPCKCWSWVVVMPRALPVFALELLAIVEGLRLFNANPFHVLVVEANLLNVIQILNHEEVNLIEVVSISMEV